MNSYTDARLRSRRALSNPQMQPTGRKGAKPRSGVT
jgi:hypothetical protein